jgi:glycosyltransferase involved in cell wall biosynthesis
VRLLIVTDAWDPQVNGVVRTLKMTRRELAALGHTVELLTPRSFRSFPCPTYPEITLALTTRDAVAQRFDAFGPDCLHIATEGPLGWHARALARRRGWPFTTAYHTRFPEYLHARARLPLAWSYALLRRFHAASSAVMAPTPAIVEALERRGFGRVRLWSRGVDLATFDPAGERLPTGRRPVFLYVGRLAVEKNVEAFLDLDLPGEKWLAGDGPDAARLRRRYPQARWFGVLQAPQLARLYRTASVFVFPSRTDTFGLVMLEALACGTPVAAYPVAGPLDVVGGSAAAALDGDLRTACLRALEIPRDLARAHAERFSWPAAAAQFASWLHPFGAVADAPGEPASCPPASRGVDARAPLRDHDSSAGRRRHATSRP